MRDETFNAMRGSLDVRPIVELVEMVAIYNMSVRILEPLNVELEPGMTKASWTERR